MTFDVPGSAGLLPEVMTNFNSWGKGILFDQRLPAERVHVMTDQPQREISQAPDSMAASQQHQRTIQRVLQARKKEFFYAEHT
jgi:hypothetical protein